MNIFLLNLDRAADRRDYMMAELDRLMPGATVTRALAVDIRDPGWRPPELYAQGRWNSDRWSLAPSDIEIFHSHLDCWRRIAESGSPGIVMEDDLLFSDRFPAAVDSVLAARPDGIVRLDGMDRAILLGPGRDIGGAMAIAPLESPVPSSACYLMLPEIAARLSRSARIERTVDDFLFDPHPGERGARGHGLPLYQCVPAVAAQAQWAAFTDPGREMPEFLRITKRADMARRKSFEAAGPWPYRLRKELLRITRRRAEAKRKSRVLAAGGSFGPVPPAPDLRWD